MIFRIIAVALPQLIIFLLLGGRFDILGGFNKTDAGTGTLVFLFLITPIIALLFLIIEIIKYRRLVRHNKGSGSLLWRNIAIFIFIESIAINLFILSSLKMH